MVRPLILLGPMAGITDLPYRRICKEMGADASYTEMVSAQAIVYKNRNTNLLMTTDEKEQPAYLQLFGKDPAFMAEAVAIVDAMPFVGYDINMGCPVPKIVGNGEGSALMKTPKLAADIVCAMKEKTKKPISVKFRKGFTENTAVDFAKTLEDAGADAITVHGRTRDQYYEGKADWDVIREVKEAVGIPVYGSGDIWSAKDVLAMVDQTNVDGVMVARGAKGNPWIFREIKALLDGADPDEQRRPGIEARAQMMLRHANDMVALYGEYTAMRKMRSHTAWYTAGLKDSARLRAKLSYLETVEDLENILTQLAE